MEWNTNNVLGFMDHFYSSAPELCSDYWSPKYGKIIITSDNTEDHIKYYINGFNKIDEISNNKIIVWSTLCYIKKVLDTSFTNEQKKEIKELLGDDKQVFIQYYSKDYKLTKFIPYFVTKRAVYKKEEEEMAYIFQPDIYTYYYAELNDKKELDIYKLQFLNKNYLIIK